MRHLRLLTLSARTSAPVFLATACALLLQLHRCVAQDGPTIRLNTLGYFPEAPKIATVTTTAGRFRVVRAWDGAVVLTGSLSGPALNPDTGESLYTADFTALQQPGEYRLELEGRPEAAPIRIATRLYEAAFATVTRAMYLWRCGTAVQGEHGGQVFGHAPCHTNDAWLDFVSGAHEHRVASGGWHDAGDYNKYVVNAGITVGSLFRAWEDFGPEIRRIALHLPEAKDALPEFLAEIKWEIDWLLTMQEPSGLVFHKLSTTNFGPMILPEHETAERFLSPPSTAATADFVAMLAQAARHFHPYDPVYADRCREAARRGYAYLSAHPDNLPADLTGFRTGTYATRDPDDRLWAAAEFWETTGDTAALHEVEQRLRDRNAQVDRDFDWGAIGNLGIFTYLASAREGRDPALLARLRGNLLAAADAIAATAREHGYARPLGTRYSWGGNGSVARQVLLLQAAYRISAKWLYRQTALDALNHLLGRNVFGRSFVTGLGTHPPRHPHDRRSAGDPAQPPWPGYLVGGPHPKPTDWNDAASDFRSNEIAINWNGALIYALAAFLDTPRRSTVPLPAPTDQKPDVVFVPTPQKVVDRMLELANLQPGDVLYDLGCGDGRIVVTAAHRYGVRAVGFDIDPLRIRESLENVRSNQLEHLVTIRQENVFDLDLSEASVVTLYLLPTLNVRLLPQLARLRPGARILSHDFDMRGARPAHVETLLLRGNDNNESEYDETEHTLFQWIVPWEPDPAAAVPGE